MRIILFPLLFLISTRVFPCSCYNERFNSIADKVAKYEFVAFVKFKKVLDTLYTHEQIKIKGKDTALKFANAVVMEIEVLEKFKGPERINRILIWGVNSSCEMRTMPEEKWIIFANRTPSGDFQTGYCNYNKLYSNSKGERDWVYKKEILLLDSLEILYGKKTKSIETEIKYSNGKTEVRQNYKKELLWGKQEIFYSNGNKYAVYNYKKGKLHGQFQTYYAKGGLYTQGYFKKGILRKQTVWYDDSVYSKSRLTRSSEIIYKPDGRSYSSYIWNSTGIKESESFFNNQDNSYLHIVYNENGKPYYMIIENYKKKERIYKEWNTKGLLIKETHSINGNTVYQFSEK